MEKISICITYYNQEQFVRQSLESVLAIDFPCEFEILCGDDGSTDQTLDIIKEYAQKYSNIVKYFVMDRTETEKSINRASLNRLNLAKNATGDYIVFLDGDDFYCDTSFVTKALNVFKNSDNIAVCAFNFKYLYPDASEKIFKTKMQVGNIKAKDYISKCLFTHAGSCVFKNCLDKKRLESLYKINNFDDNAITIYMLQFGDLYYINRPIYMYRQTSDSLWNNATKCEKELLNAFDYKLIYDTAPKFKREILKRQFGSLKYLYKNKKNLKNQLGDLFEKYLFIAHKNNDLFIASLLTWNDLKIIEKFKIKMIWIYNKLKVKFI